MRMKNKREVQRQDKEDAKALRRRQTPGLERAVPSRDTNLVLLIVCQGTVTEVEYFEYFELASATIRAVGRAFDPEKLVEEAQNLREAAEEAGTPYDQVWCVFDKDASTPQQFHAAIQQAHNQSIEVAYSNQAFEYWLLLHFEDHQGGGLHRDDCAARVSELIAQADSRVRYNGKKGKHVSRALFDLLEADDPTLRGGGRLPRRKVAIGRARAIAERWAAEDKGPAYHESVTLVYKLVLVLQKHLHNPSDFNN